MSNVASMPDLPKYALVRNAGTRVGTLPTARTTGEGRHVLFLKFMKAVTR